MTYVEQVLRENFPNYKAMIKELLDDYSKQSKTGKHEELTMKVSYKGMTGNLVKIERVVQKATNPYCEMSAYVLEIADEADGHKHVFENVDLSEVKFIGVVVTLS